jgi:hypothetical protein
MGAPRGKTGSLDRLASPDKTMTIKAHLDPAGGSDWRIIKGGKLLQLYTDAWSCPEFLWAPDSSILAVTYSDGGAVGNYHVGLYELSAYKPRGRDVTAAVEKDFLAHYPKCHDPEKPNLAAVSWLRSGHLLVAAEVLPHSNCDDMGTFSLYEITVPDGKILGKYGQLEAKRLFGAELGPELLNADDGCFSKPGSCQIPGLHGK